VFLGRDPFEKQTENLGDKIREYRRIHGVTQKKLAEQLGVDQTTLAGWERAEHIPSNETRNKLMSIIKKN
jgi:transcriptional regulator with XRE-family HTH domain